MDDTTPPPPNEEVRSTEFSDLKAQLTIQMGRSVGAWGIAPEQIRLEWGLPRKENVVILGQRSRWGWSSRAVWTRSKGLDFI